MNNGFTIIEILISMALSLTILTMVISSVSDGASISKKVSSKQDLLESLFFTVDSIKTDLTKCGMRLQEAVRLFGLSAISNSTDSFKLIYGISAVSLTDNSYKRDTSIRVTDGESLKKNKKLLLYDPENKTFDIFTIKGVKKKTVLIKGALGYDFIKPSNVIALKEIEYKYFPKTKILKKKVDSGYFQPLIENVTDFFVSYFPESNSVLYRIEIGNREQVRGYIFLSNLSK